MLYKIKYLNHTSRFPLPDFELAGQWNIQRQTGRRRTGVMALPVQTRKFGLKVGSFLKVLQVPVLSCYDMHNYKKNESIFYNVILITFYSFLLKSELILLL
jgi:hypothetical protein